MENHDDADGIKNLTNKQTAVLINFNNNIWNALQEGVGEYKFCIVDDLHKILSVLCDMEQYEVSKVKQKYNNLNIYCKSLFPQELRKLLEK